MRLSELKTGQSATILNVLGHGGFRRRIMEMGFVRGKRVDVLQNAPLRDPIKYRIMDYEVSLRRSEAAMIVVITAEEAQRGIAVAGEAASTPVDTNGEEAIAAHGRTINVALIGNPNSGKTSLFNAISGGHEHVGNYSGVTVGAKRGVCRYGGYRFVITDLPGHLCPLGLHARGALRAPALSERHARRGSQRRGGLQSRTQPLSDHRN